MDLQGNGDTSINVSLNDIPDTIVYNVGDIQIDGDTVDNTN